MTTKYTSSIFVAIPVTKCPIAAPIAKTFDPDSGGDKSFDSIRATKDGVTYAICYTKATEVTVQGLGYFKAISGALFTYVMRDYGARWGDLIPPTLEECEDFRTSITLITGKTLAESLAQAGMTFVPMVEP